MSVPLEHELFVSGPAGLVTRRRIEHGGKNARSVLSAPGQDVSLSSWRRKSSHPRLKRDLERHEAPQTPAARRVRVLLIQRNIPAHKPKQIALARSEVAQAISEIQMRLPHSGIQYEEFMGELSAKRGTRRYLEIGVQTGKLMAQIAADHAVGVDPDFRIKHNLATKKKTLTLHQCTSDEYFDVHRQDDVFDLIFIDGMHTFEYALRDFYNAEAASHPGTLIILHDCLPVDSPMIDRVEEIAAEKSRNPLYDSWWTGDVWKIISILRDTRPDLHVVGLDCPPTGLLCVTKLDPTSRVLRQNYLDIVRKCAAVPNTWESVLKAYRNLPVVASAAVTKAFDHSLYFQV